MIECLGLERFRIVFILSQNWLCHCTSDSFVFVLLFDCFQCYLFFTLISFRIHLLARLVLESDFFGRIKIRGENTNRYLCLNKKGQPFTRVRIVLRKILTTGKVSLDVSSFALFP